MTQSTNLNKDTYTNAEVKSMMGDLVASEVMRHRMSDAEKRIADLELNMANMFSELKHSIEALSQSVNSRSDEITRCRDTVLKEAADDAKSKYTSKVEFEHLVGTVRVQGTKISLFLGAVYLLAEFVRPLLQ